MGQDSRIRFEQFSFPVLPGLVYEKDGNQRIGELLFIDDSRGRFQIYFESGMACFDMLVWERNPEQLSWQEHSFGAMKLLLCYPGRDCRKQSRVGYFRAELTDSDGVIHALPGQITLEQPARQLDGLRCLTALCELMDELRFEPAPAEDSIGA